MPICKPCRRGNLRIVGPELKAFREALASVRSDIQQVAENLEEELGPEDRALFGVYLSILDDSALGGEVAALIKAGEWAQGALSQVMLRHIRHFERMEHSYCASAQWTSAIWHPGAGLPAGCEPARSRLSRCDGAGGRGAHRLCAGEIPREKLVGIVSMRGSANSHTAILARGHGYPGRSRRRGSAPQAVARPSIGCRWLQRPGLCESPP